MPKFDHPLTYKIYEDPEGMGFSLRDVGGFFEDVFDVAKEGYKFAVDPFDVWTSKAERAIKTGIIQKVDSIDDLKYIASKVIVPQSYYMELYVKIPGSESIIEPIDQFTGGLYTDVKISLAIPGKVVKGEKVTPYEMMVALQTGLKVSAIVVSGGSAASIIAVSAGQLKKGTLGETEKGSKILGVVEIAAYAFAATQSIGDIAADQAKKKALTKAEKVALEKTNLGKSYLGRTLVHVGGNVYTDGEKGFTDFATSYAKKKAVQRLPQGKYIVKYGPFIYEGVIEKDFEIDLPSTDDLIAKAQMAIAKEIEKAPDTLKAKVKRATEAKFMKLVAKIENILIEKLLGQGRRPDQIREDIINKQQDYNWQIYLKYKKYILGGALAATAAGSIILLKKREKI